MIVHMLRTNRLQSETHVAPNGQWALGRVHLGVLQPTAHLSGHGDLQLLFHGDLHNELELRQTLATEHQERLGAGTTSLIEPCTKYMGHVLPRSSKAPSAPPYLILVENRILASDQSGSY